MGQETQETFETLVKRACREDGAITNAELCRTLREEVGFEISQSNVSRYFSGELNPNAAFLAALSVAYHWSESELTKVIHAYGAQVQRVLYHTVLDSVEYFETTGEFDEKTANQRESYE